MDFTPYSKCPYPVAYIKMDLTADGKPKDYKFVQFNPAFRVQSNFKVLKENMYLYGDINKDYDRCWLDEFYPPCYLGETVEFHRFSLEKKYCFSGTAVPMEPGYCLLFMHDDTPIVRETTEAYRKELSVVQARENHQHKMLQHDLMAIQGLADEYDLLRFIYLPTRRYTNSYVGKMTTVVMDVEGNDYYEDFINSMSKYCHPDYLKNVLKTGSPEFIKAVLRHKKRYTFDFACNNPQTNDYTWVKLVLIKLDAVDNEPRNIAMGFINIDRETKRKLRRQEILDKQNKQLEFNFNAIKGLASEYTILYFWDLPSDEYTTYFWENSFSKFGDGRGEVHKDYCKAHAEYVRRFCHPDDREKMMIFADKQAIIDTLRHRKKHSVVFRAKSAYGGWVWMNFVLVKFDPMDSTPTKISVGFANIDAEMTEKIVIQNRLERTKRDLDENNAIMGNAGFGVWHITFTDGKEPAFGGNEKMLELMGIPDTNMTEEEIYKFWYERIEKKDIPSELASVDEMVNGLLSENTYGWYHPQKGKIYVRCGGALFRKTDTGYTLGGYHGEVTDMVLAERKRRRELSQALERAEAANKAKTAFLFNMSHDIRTPMNAVIGFADLMESHWGDEERVRDYLTKLKTSSRFLLSLLDNVLEMARIESGKTVLIKAPWNPVEFNDALCSVFEDSMRQKNINFIREMDFKSSRVLVDSTKLREIYLNILSNAVKYTPAGGQITMKSTELPGDKPGYSIFKTVISDTGIGMSRDYLPLIFEEFSRERTATEDKVAGTGLGMAIVKALVELMDGEISVESRLGQGTSFTVTIPHEIYTDDKISKGEDDELPIDCGKFKGKRILLAEDNDLNAEIASTLLTDAGFVVDSVKNGSECIEKIKNRPVGYYDAVLMDIQMPVMNGYETTAVIRKMYNPNARLPIFAMTANAFEEDRESAAKVGMNGHISKPVDVNKMLKMIAKVLK